jgi:hypothetical protein
MPPPPGGPGGGGLLSAISNALSQIGVTDQSSATGSTDSTGSDDSSTSTTQDPAQALASFMQNLMAALHAQGASSPQQSGDADGDGGNATQAASGVRGGHHHHGGAGKMEADLSSLIQNLSSSTSSATSDSSSTDQTSTTSSTVSSADSTLQQSFSSLMQALGNTNSNATLTGFLQALQSNMQGAGPAGNVVNTKV